jgi:hypothetical protein
MNSFLRKLRWLTQRPWKEAELREELQFHLARKRNSVRETAWRRKRPDGRRAANWATSVWWRRRFHTTSRAAPNDPLALTVAVMILLSAALLAGYMPARNASRIDPMTAVRHE